jgi:hypothetical protein
MRILATLSQISAVGLYCPPEKRTPGRVLHLWLLVIRLEVLIDTAFCEGKDNLALRVVPGVKVTLGALRGQYYLGVISSSWYYTLDSLHHFNTERGEEKFATFRSGTEGQTGSGGKNNKGFVTATLEHFNRNEGIKSTVKGAYTPKGHRPNRDSRITREYVENLRLDPEFNADTFEKRVDMCLDLYGQELSSDSFGVFLIYNCRYYLDIETGELDSLVVGHLVEDTGALEGGLVRQANGRKVRPIAWNLDKAAVAGMYHSFHDDVASMKKDMLATFVQFVWPKLADNTVRIPSWPAAQLRQFVLDNPSLCAAVRGDGPQGGGAGSGGGREVVDGAHELEQDRKGGAHSILVSSGQAKQLSRDQLRPLALNPNKSPVERVVGEIVAASNAAEQQALEAM